MMIKKFLSVADHLLGHSVHDAVGEQIGKIKDVFIDPDSNRPVFAVLSTGGFLGLGSDQMVLPWHTLAFNTNSHDIKLTIDRKELKNAPEVDVEKLRGADREETQKLFNFYGEGGLDKPKDTNEEDNSFEQPDAHKHQAYEGSAKVTDEQPKDNSNEASENMDYEKAKGSK